MGDDKELNEELHAIFAIVKARTGHDFSSYKRNTVLRRIERRMMVNEALGLKEYLTIIEESPLEAQSLCQEILIGVTSFFRDPEAFEFLRSEIIPRLFADRDPENPVRIWHACCSTGEEAYSVAMLIQEHLEKESLHSRVQIFATDIDEAAVAKARAGLYPDNIVEELGEERLNSYFTRSNGRWQVAKRLREMIVFANHSIIKDPPFSRLDLLVCRNLLIYLDPDMQKRLVSLFHMVLKPGGMLFLGASETVGHLSELFTPLHKKWKIFQRLESSRREEPFFPFTSPARKHNRNAPPRRSAENGEPTPGAVAERLLVERYSPPCVVVNEKYEVLHISTRIGRYMEIPVGEPTLDILRMAREELKPALRAAIYKAFTEQKQVAFRGVKIAIDAGEEAVNVLVEPLAANSSYGKLVIVILEPVPLPVNLHPITGDEALPADESSREMLIRQLEEQLRISHEQLQATSEQLESSNEGFLSANEELMSINEEFQSANEELQSTNEELETSKEELQALNEELVTVNFKLQGKVEELNETNSDMENLFASSEIATIFLDRALTIKRFSPAMAAIFNLIPADIGRPFRYHAGTIDWHDLAGDAQTVLEKHVPIEHEVTSFGDRRCFIMRILPYRTSDERIDGVVITLSDISELRKAEEAIRSAALFPEENPSPVLRVARDGTLLYANLAAAPLLEQWRSTIEGTLPDFIQRELTAALACAENRELEFQCRERYHSFMLVPITERGYVNLYGRDITGRKLAEEELLRSKQEWERTFASVPDPIAILDNQHRILRVNNAMALRLGLKPEECVGRPCYEAVHGTSFPPDSCPHSKTIVDGREHFEELHEDRLGGDFLVTTTPLLDEKENRIGSVHIARNITERKRMEEGLRKSEEQLKRAQEISHIGSWDLDLVKNKLTWSDETYRIFGLQPQEFSATYEAFLEVVHPEDRAMVDAAYTGSVREGKDSYEIEHRIVRKSTGEIRIIHEKCEHFRDASGGIIRSVGMVHDITEQMRAEEALRASEEHLRTLLVNIPGAAYRCEIKAPWRMNFMSEGVEAITGHPASEFLHQDGVVWGDLVLPGDLPGVEQAVELGVANKAPYEMEYRIRHADGSIRWVFEQGRAVYDSEGRPRFLDGVIVNITARKQAEMELLQAKEAAEAATRTKSQFLANMSHELRTPMTGVLGMLEIALDDPLGQEQRETIEMAHKSAGSLLRIINDILDLTKVESGKLSMEKAPFTLNECISGPINILISEARRKGLELVWSLAEDMPKTVIGDQMRLRQVLTNLLGNAVKFTEKGKVELKVAAGGKTADGRLNVSFTVTDSGIGIPCDKIDIIFQPFSQADVSNTRRYGGTGLGLAISWEIVKLMGGTIECKSEEGLGSIFTFSVPLGETGIESKSDAPVGSALQQQCIQRITGVEARPRLLVAEDDLIIQQLLGRIFKKANYDYDFAANGVTAVEKWENGSYDLILMDVQMPLMDGFKATAAIREKERLMGGHTTIIAMTAHTLKEDEERCITAGMDAYISKPVDVRKCLELIGDFINKSK